MKSSSTGSKSVKITPLDIFHDNLNSMREYYRSQEFSGHNLGHNVLMEMSLSHMHLALSMAIEGKKWEPPS